MTQVKICGLTTLNDAVYAAEMGADMLGFIFAPVSKRYITPAAAQPIIAAIRQQFTEKTPLCIGVFVVDSSVDAATINAQCRTSGVDAAQIVGLDDPEFLSNVEIPAYVCIRPETSEQASHEAALFQRNTRDTHLPTLQLDAFHPNLYGGTGQTTSKTVARLLSEKTERLMLAGGLTPDNVADYIRVVAPWAVDVASGTEASPGKKDPRKVRDFIQAAKSAAQPSVK